MKRKTNHILLLTGLVSLFLWSCNEQPEPEIFQKPPIEEQETPIELENELEESDPIENQDEQDFTWDDDEALSDNEKETLEDSESLENFENESYNPEQDDEVNSQETEEIEEADSEPEPVLFSVSGNVEYETELQLLCNSENPQIYYSYEEFLPEDYLSQKKYSDSIILTDNCFIYAVTVNKTVTSAISSANFIITNKEDLIFGETETYIDEECTQISVPSNIKYSEENDLAVIKGQNIKITVTKNTATQPENWIDSWRIYYTKNPDKISNSITFSSENKKIIKILFQSPNYTQGKFTVSDGDFDTKKGIWSGCSDSLVFTPTANAQLNKITVIYSTE